MFTMKTTKRTGRILLGIFLILLGVLPQFNIPILALVIVLGVLSFAAGVVLFTDLPRTDYTSNLGILLLSAWLVVQGIFIIFDLNFVAANIILAVLAIAAGVVLLTGWPARRGFPRNIATILLCIWLILDGISLVFVLPAEGALLVLLAIATGILLIFL
jgi:hypothetical protein